MTAIKKMIIKTHAKNLGKERGFFDFSD